MSEDSEAINKMRQENVKGENMTPEQARIFLEGLGYEESQWTKLLDQGLGSHYMRALAQVVKENRPRNLDEVMGELFPDEQHSPALQKHDFGKILNKQILGEETKLNKPHFDLKSAPKKTSDK